MAKRIFGILAFLSVLGLPLLGHAGNMTFSASSNTRMARQFQGSVIVISGTATFSSSYATGGDTLPASAVGLSKILWISTPGLVSDGSHLVSVDQANAKVLAFTALGTQASASTDLSAETITVRVYGY